MAFKTSGGTKMCVAAEIEIVKGVIAVTLHAMRQPENPSVETISAEMNDKNVCFLLVGPVNDELCFTAVGPFGNVIHHHHKTLTGPLDADDIDRDAFLKMARGWGESHDMAIAVATAALKAFECALNITSGAPPDDNAKMEAAQPAVAKFLDKYTLH